MSTIAITGSASGIGAATAARLAAAGHRIIAVDLHDADIEVDLSSREARTGAVDAIVAACGGVLDGLVTCAGLGGIPGRPGSLLVDVNYFGTVDLLDGLRPALSAAPTASAVAIASNSTTIQPGIPDEVVAACLSGDRDEAAARADAAGSVATYPATKTAICRWVRRHAPGADWAGAGIRLNAVSPGMIETALVAEQRADAEMGPMLDLLPIPMGRPGRSDEIAALVEFLLGPNSTFFCGSVVLADGGTEALLRPDDWPTPWALDIQAVADTFGAADS